MSTLFTKRLTLVFSGLCSWGSAYILECCWSWYQYWGKRWLSGDSCRLALIWQWHCLVTVVSIGSSSTLALPLNFRVRCDFWQYSFKCSNWAIDSWAICAKQIPHGRYLFITRPPEPVSAPEVLPIMWINYLISGRKYIWNAHCPPFHFYYKGTTYFCLCNLSSDSLFRVLLWNHVAQR